MNKEWKGRRNNIKACVRDIVEKEIICKME